MTLEYALLEKDYLDYQLYVASQNVRNRKARFRTRIALPIVAVLCAAYFWTSADYAMAIAYVLGALLWYWLFGYYQTWYRHRHFARFVHETFAEDFGLELRMEISDVDIRAYYDAGSETKVMLSDIKSIVEIPSIILVGLKGGGRLILPKERIAELDALRNRLQEIAISLGITYERKDDWKWK